MIVTAHPEIDYRRVVARLAWCWTSAASPAGSSRRTSCGSVNGGRAVTVGVVGLGYWGPNLARNFASLERL